MVLPVRCHCSFVPGGRAVQALPYTGKAHAWRAPTVGANDARELTPNLLRAGVPHRGGPVEV